MTVDRRQFLKGLTAGGALAAAATGAAPEANALQRAAKPRSPEALGLLYDSTLCIGCRACVAACKEANATPDDVSRGRTGITVAAETVDDLSGWPLNSIEIYQHGSSVRKDREENGFAYIKRQCLHCVYPSCVSCCPVSAMIKDPMTGIVRNDPDRCIGCRYCVYACPFQVPKYEYERTFGRIRKCELCQQRLQEGRLPGCVESCPTGATVFGRVEDLRVEAHRRIALESGDMYAYPRGDLSGRYGTSMKPREKVVRAAYRQEVYGENQLGGTQCLCLSAVSFDKLGLPFGPDIPTHSYASQTEVVQHFLYADMIAPVAALTGLILLARRNVDRQHGEAEQESRIRNGRHRDDQT